MRIREICGKGRFSQPGYCYFITTGTKSRLPVLSDPAASKIDMDCLRWQNEQGKIDLIAAVVMPNPIHFAARLLGTILPSLMHSLKRFASNKINDQLGRKGPIWESRDYDHAIRTDQVGRGWKPLLQSSYKASIEHLSTVVSKEPRPCSMDAHNVKVILLHFLRT